MSSVLVPELSAVDEPEVLVDESELEVAFQLDVPGTELHQFAFEGLDDALVVTCELEDDTVRRELELPPEADVSHLTITLEEGVLEVRVPKHVFRDRRAPVPEPSGHLPGFHPDATPC